MNNLILLICLMALLLVPIVFATETNLNDDSGFLYISQEEKAKSLLPYIFFFLVLLVLLAILKEKWKA